jgi:hypothetical protein
VENSEEGFAEMNKHDNWKHGVGIQMRKIERINQGGHRRREKLADPIL